MPSEQSVVSGIKKPTKPTVSPGLSVDYAYNNPISPIIISSMQIVRNGAVNSAPSTLNGSAIKNPSMQINIQIIPTMSISANIDARIIKITLPSVLVFSTP